MIKNIPVNPHISFEKLFGIVNRVMVDDLDESFERWYIAEKWVCANKKINFDQCDELMNTLAFIYRELNHREF